MKHYPRVIGLVIGALYGLMLRGVFEWKLFRGSYEIVSGSFLLLAPFAAGAIAVFFGSRAGRLSVGEQIGTAAGTMVFFLVAMFVLFIEGMICIVLVLPVFMIASIIGGLAMGLSLRLVKYNGAVVSSVALLPLVLAPLESRLTPASHERTVVNTVVIDASATDIWNNLTSVADIQKQELGFSFTHAMGVPRPLQAAMDGAGVGAVRTSQWEKGVQFREVITQWQPPYKLSYDFDIPPNSIPRDALDRHVEIGGEYFTVVDGSYTIRPLSAEQCEVTLQTTYANRSNLKLYGDLWGDFVFDDFHRSILRLIKHRAERAQAPASNAPLASSVTDFRYASPMARKRSKADQVSKMADLARIAGVSVSSVSRALAGSPLVARERREKILELAREHGYVLNTQAQNLRLRRTQTLSVVIPLGHESGQPLTDPFFVELLGHLADAITDRGYGMFLLKVVPPMGDWLESLITSSRSDGIVVIGQSTEHKALEAAAQRYAPMVVWGGQLPRQSYCTVGTDNKAGARAAVEHLIERGRRRIVFLGDPTVPEIKLRYQGYLAALNDGPSGMAPPRSVPAHLLAESSYADMRAFLDEHGEFDAVFAASDVIAMSAIRAITAAGLSVPKDVAVVGYDDIALAAHTNPPLTTVKQDLRAGAQTMIELLFKRMAGATTDSVILPTRLIVRQSS